MLGSRALFHDGWKVTTDHVGAQLSVERERVPGSAELDADHWALFDLRTDFAEAHDVGAQHPDRLRALQELWWVEAGRNQVLPITDSFLGRVTALIPSPWGPRWRAVLRPGGGAVNEDVLPPLSGGFRLLAEVEVGERAGGVLCALGDWSNGWACYLLDGRPVLVFNLLGALFRFAGEAPLAAGRHRVTASYDWSDRERAITLAVDGHVVAAGPLRARLPMRWQIGGAGLLVGRDAGFPVCDDYQPPFPFSGTLARLVIEVPALAPRDAAQETAAALQRE
jgi:arylsulfatase